MKKSTKELKELSEQDLQVYFLKILKEKYNIEASRVDELEEIMTSLSKSNPETILETLEMLSTKNLNNNELLLLVCAAHAKVENIAHENCHLRKKLFIKELSETLLGGLSGLAKNMKKKAKKTKKKNKE